MATSKKQCVLTALIVVLAVVVAPNLKPSAAIRVEAVVADKCNGYHQEAAIGAGAGAAAKCDSYHPEAANGATIAAAADQPLAGGCGGAQPRECRPLLQGMLPCAAFLIEAGVYAPDQACCDGFNAMFGYDTITCACHVVNGDIGQMLPAPMRPARIVELFAACGRQNVPVDRFAAACRATLVPPIDAPPVPLPTPPSPPMPSPPSPPVPTEAFLPQDRLHRSYRLNDHR